MANLLASMITALIVAVAVHLYLDRHAPESTRPADSEEPPTVRTSFSGIAPKQALRLELTEGYVEVDELRLWQRVTVDQGGSARDLAPDAPEGLADAELGGLDLSALTGQVDSPQGEREAIFRVRFKVTDADEETLRLSWKMLDAEVLPHGDNPAWDKAVKATKKLRGTTLIERTGHPLEATIKGLGAREPVGQELETLLRRWLMEPTPVFPTEPVGHGAVWEVTRSLTDAGVQTRQTQRFEVKELRRGRIRLIERVSGALESARIELGPKTAFETRVGDFSVSGDGKWTASLDTLMAPGDAGGSASARIDISLGIATIGTSTTVDSEVFVTRVE